MKNILLIFVFIFFNLLSYGQSDYEIITKACRTKSDSIFNIFIKRWQNAVTNNNNQNINDSLYRFQQLIFDFYSKKIDDFKTSNNYLSGINNKYLIIDLRRIKIEYVEFKDKSGNLTFDLSINNNKTIEFDFFNHDSLEIPFKSVLGFFSNSNRYNITSEYVLRDFNCIVNYDRVLYLNDTYNDLITNFVKRKNRLGFRNQMDFYVNRIVYYWIYPDYGTINNIKMFSSGKVAIVSYNSGSVCSIDELYCLKDGRWSQIGKLNFECISVSKMK